MWRFLLKFRVKFQKIIWIGEAIAHNEERLGVTLQDLREPEITERQKAFKNLGGREDRRTYIIKLFGRFNK